MGQARAVCGDDIKTQYVPRGERAQARYTHARGYTQGRKRTKKKEAPNIRWSAEKVRRFPGSFTSDTVMSDCRAGASNKTS